VFAPVMLPPQPVVPAPDPDYDPAELEADQLAAADVLRETVTAGGFGVTLLDGVTGSGKTEVYFEAIAETIRQGRQVLILLPEIALTNPVSRPVSQPVRGAAGGMAFRAGAADARKGLAAGDRGPCQRGGRRAFGAVPAFA
jgi:hypothetical protein